MRRLALAILLVLALGAAGIAVAATRPSVRVAPTTVERGELLTVSGTGWARSANVELLVGPPRSEADHVGSVRTTSRGTFRRRLRISSRAATGRFVLLACRRECRVKATVSFRVSR